MSPSATVRVGWQGGEFISAKLSEEVLDAIVSAVGQSLDQVSKAVRDAGRLADDCGLNTDQWDEAAFTRMGHSLHWSASTLKHRWGIFSRCLSELRQRRSGKSNYHTAVETRTVDAECHDQLESTVSLSTECSWVTVLSAEGVPYRFPDEPTSHMRHEYRGPAIYRWVLSGCETESGIAYYIGEAAILARRIRNYVHPGPTQWTSRRMNATLTEHGLHGGSAVLERLCFDSIALNDTVLTRADLTNKLIRVAIEHLMITLQLKHGDCLLNAKADPAGPGQSTRRG